MAEVVDRPRRRPGVLRQQASGTAVLLRLDGGMYYTLNGVGERVWDLCDGTRTVPELASAVAEEFDAPAERIAADVTELVEELAAEGLVDRDLGR